MLKPHYTLPSGGTRMRKVIFGCANSLDNYIARKNGEVDWLIWDKEAGEIMKDFWPRFDTVVMGRITYDIAMKNAPRQTKTKKNPYGDIRTFVFSRKLQAGPKDGIEIVNSDPGKFVSKLKLEPGKDICIMGGGVIAASLLEAGVIDEIGFNIHPVLLGSGVQLFHGMKKQIDLQLIDCKQMTSGCVYVLYKIKR